jgi:GH25 family lysozyme M1 (1,4-beta-N-acetylmuramidase)
MRLALLSVVVLLVLALCRSGEATYGVDISQASTISTFQCLVNNGYSFAIIRAYQSIGQPDPNGPHSVYNAWDGGMSNVDVYMFPCPQCGASASDQVTQAVQYLQSYNTKYGMFWFDIEGPQYWNDQASNQAWLSEAISTAQSLGQNIGIYTSASQWGPIMGGWTGASQFPLWYAHYDDNPSFSDFVPFGGWSSPNIKQFVGDATVCGMGVDENWYP